MPGAASEELLNIAQSLRPDPLKQEVDVGKLRGIEFMELLQERRKVLAERQKIDTSSIDSFEEQVRYLKYNSEADDAG